MSSRLDQMMAESPIRDRPQVLRWMIELFELWDGAEAQSITARRQEIARLVFNVSGVTPGPVTDREGRELQSSDLLAWTIRLGINTLRGTATGAELRQQREVFLGAAHTVPLPLVPRKRILPPR